MRRLQSRFETGHEDLEGPNGFLVLLLLNATRHIGP